MKLFTSSTNWSHRGTKLDFERSGRSVHARARRQVRRCTWFANRHGDRFSTAMKRFSTAISTARYRMSNVAIQSITKSPNARCNNSLHRFLISLVPHSTADFSSFICRQEMYMHIRVHVRTYAYISSNGKCRSTVRY